MAVTVTLVAFGIRVMPSRVARPGINSNKVVLAPGPPHSTPKHLVTDGGMI